MYDPETIADARRKCEAARKAEAEGHPGLARQLLMQAADRYRAGGMTATADDCRRRANAR